MILNIFLNICADDFNLILKAIDLEDNQVTQVAVGVPFLIKLVIESSTQFNDVQGNPVIDKIENVNIQKVPATSTMIRTINGKTTVSRTYQYDIRIDKEGFYNLGPAKIKINSQEYKSNILKLNVSNAVAKKTVSERGILKLEINKQNLYVGEHAKLSIKFYYQDEQIRLINIENPALQDWTFDNFVLTSSGNEEVDGKQYLYQEFSANVYPKKSGELLIPSVVGYYEESRNNLNMFINFFNQIQRKQIVSQALRINVKPLPPTQEKVDAVGTFNSFTASINQNNVVEGEGIVLKLELKGDADFNNINLQALQLPEQFKYYDSKNYVTELGKTFEFIVQAEASGDFQIPVQKFTYFDVVSKTYKALFTKPMLVHIKPLPEAKPEVQEDCQEPGSTCPAKLEERSGKGASAQKPKYINFYLFLLLLILPVILKLFLYFRARYKPDPIFKLERLLRQGKSAGASLYQIFITYFAEKFGVNKSLITQDFIEKKFREYNLPKETINKWDLFFVKINELSYGPERDYDALLEEARIWSIVFKDKLKP